MPAIGTEERFYIDEWSADRLVSKHGIRQKHGCLCRKTMDLNLG
uniref:Uncharacterized protein n=1 Tax=Faecalibaculum rodentium TaxID=1702221 RepID=A0A140DRY5_9FIRM|nr:hypothetical protein AALO17_02780 [Faecalibaculum rodentium]